MTADPLPFLRREAELARLDAALDAVVGGAGRLLVLVGPAGIGKTALVRQARGRAEERGMRVLAAAASELDRDFPFGLVHQLLDGVVADAEPERRARLLSGAAARAAAVLEPARDTELPQDPGHAVLHGLHWLIANLAEERPLVLLVEDLHWADRASLRLLEYLARRLEALPVLLVATARPNEPGAETDLLLALETAAAAEVVRPRALDAAATAELLTAALGATPDDAFVAGCLDATGGNPLLLRTLARQAAERGVAGRADEYAAVGRLAATELSVVVRRRLAGLGPDAVALAHAAAVLGHPARLDDLAAVAGLDAAAARAAADALVAADLLEAPDWRFVHPVVRRAVTEATPPAERAHLHARAAGRLRDGGALPGRIAVHLLAADPAGDPDVVAALRAAARIAAAEGAPEAGAVHLRRALAEPPPGGERAAVLLELGELEARAGDPAGVEHLTAALEAGLTGDAAARARAARGALRLHLDPAPALDEFIAGSDDAGDPQLRVRLEGLALEASVFHVGFVARRAELLAAARARPDASPVVCAHLAQEAAYGSGTPLEILELATGATAGDRLLGAVGPASATFNLLVHALRVAERPAAARALLDRGEAVARRDGLRFADFFLEHAWGYWHWDSGSIAAGLSQASTGLDKVRTGGFDATVPALLAVVGGLLVEADRLDEAVALVDELGTGVAEIVGGPFALATSGLVRLRQRRITAAEADLRAAIDQFDRRGWVHASSYYARLPLAEVLAAQDARDEAIATAREAAAILEASERPGAAAAARRVEGLVTGGESGLTLLADAATRLEGSPLVRERGWALYELGAALRRAGRRAEARDPLRGALDVATRSENARLVRLAREELAAAGARPVREVLSGPAALTPSERRVADLAASGLSNREIAETLWVTRKTVEVHLGSAYGKLGIRSRAQLADVLVPPGDAAAAA